MGSVIALLHRATAPAISIAIDPLGYGYEVRVLPTPAGIGHDREHRTLEDARRYAALLSKATGWPVVDHAGGAGVQ